MLHMMKRACAAREREILRRMFAARKEVFVDLLHWDVPVIDGQYEIDQFDDEHALYLIVADRGGGHMASARLLPTTRPHILADLYAPLCDGDVPRGPNILEVTRFCLDRNLNAAARRHARNKLVSAIAEYGVINHIRLFTGVADASWFEQIVTFGWHCYPLGLPQSLCGRTLCALAIEIADDTLERMEQAGIYMAPDQEGAPCHVA